MTLRNPVYKFLKLILVFQIWSCSENILCPKISNRLPLTWVKIQIVFTELDTKPLTSNFFNFLLDLLSWIALLLFSPSLRLLQLLHLTMYFTIHVYHFSSYLIYFSTYSQLRTIPRSHSQKLHWLFTFSYDFQRP